jgi:hypothetical protein
MSIRKEHDEYESKYIQILGQSNFPKKVDGEKLHILTSMRKNCTLQKNTQFTYINR